MLVLIFQSQNLKTKYTYVLYILQEQCAASKPLSAGPSFLGPRQNCAPVDDNFCSANIKKKYYYTVACLLPNIMKNRALIVLKIYYRLPLPPHTIQYIKLFFADACAEKTTPASNFFYKKNSTIFSIYLLQRIVLLLSCGQHQFN